MNEYHLDFQNFDPCAPLRQTFKPQPLILLMEIVQCILCDPDPVYFQWYISCNFLMIMINVKPQKSFFPLK